MKYTLWLLAGFLASCFLFRSETNKKVPAIREQIVTIALPPVTVQGFRIKHSKSGQKVRGVRFATKGPLTQEITFIDARDTNIVLTRDVMPWYWDPADTVRWMALLNAKMNKADSGIGGYASWLLVKKKIDSLAALITTPLSISAGSGVSITNTAGIYIVSLTPPTINTTARSTNTNFTPSTTRYTLGIYSVTCSVTNPLLAGSSTVNAYLEYSNNNGASWSPAAPSQVGNSSSVALTVTVQLTNGQTGNLIGIVPPGYISRIRTVTTG